MRKHIATITDVAEQHLCTGCGVCAFVQPDDIRMVDDLDAGRRPLVRPGAATDEALGVCPGVALEHPDRQVPGVDPELLAGWGPVLEVWEGHATDPEIRLAGSSGGAATALALHAITDGGAHGVLHTTARTDVPVLNETTLSRSREELLGATGSRYAPASPADGLQRIADAPGPCVFIGKPCDVAATEQARRIRPDLDRNLALTIGIFCAGTPSTRGTLELLERLGVATGDQLSTLRYRGNGWPGRAEATVATGEGDRRSSMSYAQSWGQLQKHRQWRCYVCADHTGEFADVSVGDPWYRTPGAGERGDSLVVVRTERGRAAVRAAVADGAIELRRLPGSRLPDSQPNLLATRGGVWARIVTTRALGVAAPRYRNLPTFVHWRRELGLVEQLRSFTGTVRRVGRKRLRHRRAVRPWEVAEMAQPDPPRYVVITPARDEEEHLELLAKTIEAQTWRPTEWIVVDDGSTDGTGAIADALAATHDWITVVHRADRGRRVPGGGVVETVLAGLDACSVDDWDYLVKLDADLELEPDYFERCLRRMELDERWGITGGQVHDRLADGRIVVEGHPMFHVRGATKIYRRATWDAIGGLVVAKGWDTLDEVKANQLGWRTTTFSDIPIVQQRETGRRAGWWKDWSKNGRAAWFCGYHPAFVVARSARVATMRPVGLKGLALLWGYVEAVVRRRPRVDDPDLRRYTREQQLRRLLRRDTIWR
ncbi:MAG: Coenzyme F420 hydrogenase/dehydrogenase, beta subunit C-terminal domain [Actinomycetota bacterium]